MITSEELVTLTNDCCSGFGDVDSYLKEMCIASAINWPNEPLDIFNTSSVFPDFSDYCPAEVVEALDEELLISDEESSSSEEETFNNPRNWGSSDLNQNIDLPLNSSVGELKRQRSRSRSFSDSLASCSEEGELGETTVEEVASIEDSSEVSRGEQQAMWTIYCQPQILIDL